MRVKGLEPLRREAPDPKSGLATNYNTPAKQKCPTIAGRTSICGKARLLLVHKAQMLYIDRLLLGDTPLLGRLRKVLAGTELTYGTGLLELPLEFLEGPLDVFAFFDGNYNHAFITSFLFADCKGRKFFLNSNCFNDFLQNDVYTSHDILLGYDLVILQDIHIPGLPVIERPSGAEVDLLYDIVFHRDTEL